MAWFRLDDGFHSHPKVLRAGNAAIGLYTRCGTWCSDQLTDGYIPTEIARVYGRRNEIETLVRERLWVTVPGGYQMPDFLEFNPSAEQVKAQRAAATERQRQARERAKEQRESQGMSRRDSHVTEGVSHAPPDPTRPLLTSRPLTTSDVGTRRPGTEDDLDVPMAGSWLRVIGQ